MNIRVPTWAAGKISITINGKPVAATPGTYATISRTWSSRDRVDVFFEMSLWSSVVEDDRPDFNSTFAFMYGPLVLAGLTDSNVFLPEGHGLEPTSFITRTSRTALNFSASGKDFVGHPKIMAMIPLFQIMEEEYCVYFKTSGESNIPYSPGGAAVPSASSGDWQFSGAGIAPTRQPGASVDLRTDGPNSVSTMTMIHPIVGQNHDIAQVSLSFCYVAGYDSGPGAWPTLSVVLLDAVNGKTVKTVWASSPLDKYEFDHFTG